MECLGHNRQLAQLCHRLDTRYDGDGDTHLPSLLHEVEEFIVVEEQLGHRILCP